MSLLSYSSDMVFVQNRWLKASALGVSGSGSRIWQTYFGLDIDSVTVAWLVKCFGAQGIRETSQVFSMFVFSRIAWTSTWTNVGFGFSTRFLDVGPSTCCSWCGSFFRYKCRCTLTRKGKFRCIWLPTACTILLALANSWFRLFSQNVFNARARNRSELFPDLCCKLAGAPFACYSVLDICKTTSVAWVAFPC